MFYVAEEEELDEDVNTLTVLEQSLQYPPKGWESIFSECTEELNIISDIVKNSGEYYPEPRLLFRAFRMLPLERVKVVIIGESPYPGKGNACGLSFSSDKTVPGSLRNIFKELEREYDNFSAPKIGDLTEWVVQGVLLLNSCLTYSIDDVKINKRAYWTPFIMKIIKAICNANPNSIFVLWGNHAQKYKDAITTKKICGTHPSPNTYGFIGCGHFSLINDTLEKAGQSPIDWRL